MRLSKKLPKKIIKRYQCIKYRVDAKAKTARCGFEIYKMASTVFVVLTETEFNPSVDITSAIEHLANFIYFKWLKECDPSIIVWVEHYPQYPVQRDITKDTYDQVLMKLVEGMFVDPEWISIDPSKWSEYGFVKRDKGKSYTKGDS